VVSVCTINEWNKLPSFILFDGRPYESYDSITFKRVAFISDSYMNYMIPKDSIDIKLKQLITGTHNKGKLLSFGQFPIVKCTGVNFMIWVLISSTQIK
jgi:hypothetical protein